MTNLKVLSRKYDTNSFSLYYMYYVYTFRYQSPHNLRVQENVLSDVTLKFNGVYE